MQRYIVLMILILCVVSTLMAVPYEQTEEYRQKQAILNERAARFKAETGFKGDFQYDHGAMKISEYWGHFPNIQFTSPMDTTSCKQTFYSIFEKIVPYISAERHQLVEAGISISEWSCSIRFVQKANGYPIETGGRLNIVYYPKQNRLFILDETVDIPPTPVGSIISEDEAYSIAWEHYSNSQNYDSKAPKVKRIISILYRNRIQNGKQQPFRLCWKVVFPGILYYIDAYTSEFYTEGYVINYERSSHSDL